MTLKAGADVTVSGSGGVGLYAESTGGTTNGAIDITVYTGATITASDDATAAVSFVNGDGNTLTNDGTITTDDLTSVVDLRADVVRQWQRWTSPTTELLRLGRISPTISTFTNNSGATLNSGPTFYLGSSGTLTNDGTISPGGTGTVVTSTITTGTFTQSSDGILCGRYRQQFDR